MTRSSKVISKAFPKSLELFEILTFYFCEFSEERVSGL